MRYFGYTKWRLTLLSYETLLELRGGNNTYLAGHGVGVREFRGSNPGGTIMIFAPVFRGEWLETRGS